MEEEKFVTVVGYPNWQEAVTKEGAKIRKVVHTLKELSETVASEQFRGLFLNYEYPDGTSFRTMYGAERYLRE